MMFRKLATAGLLLASLQACNTLGPSALSAGRPAYNTAIAATDAEQNLAWFVRARYGIPTTQLAVGSVTASMRFQSSANVELGFGPGENYVGNLVPFSGGFIYDENPTISYVPVRGEKHLRALLSPVSLELLGLLLNMDFQPGSIFAILVRRVNGVGNPDFLTDPAHQADDRFARLVAVITQLSNADKLAFFQSEANPMEYNVWLHDYRPDHTEDVRSFLDLLDIRGVTLDGTEIVLPVIAALRRSTNQSIAIQTRSVMALNRIASASVDVPEADRADGLTVDFPKAGLAGEYIHVRRASERPSTAVAATRFRSWWYYIAGDDLSSKLYFALYGALISVQLSKAAEEVQAPVLTVPVN